MSGSPEVHNFIINEEKSLYSVENIEYLGRQLSSEGIKPPSNTTQAIQQCPAPSSKAELRSFLGMPGFFRSFIKNFASFAHPFYRLLQEDVSFYFGVEELEAFEQLKRVLLHSPFFCILRHGRLYSYNSNDRRVECGTGRYTQSG